MSRVINVILIITNFFTLIALSNAKQTVNRYARVVKIMEGK